MATHDYVIDNQTAPNFRADLNNALLAIVSNNSSATAPAVTYANMMWYDTAANILYMRNEDNDTWIALGTLDQTSDTFAAAVALASQAEAEAGTDNTKVMTPLRVKQSVVANATITKEFVSAQQTITQAGALTIAHGLGEVPKIVQYRLVCITAQNGYSAGNIVDILSSYGASFSSSAVAYSFATRLDATNIIIRYGNKSGGTIAGINASTGNLVEFTNANWRLVVRAYA